MAAEEYRTNVALPTFASHRLSGELIVGALTLTLAICLGVISVLSLSPPDAAIDAPPTEFSSARAREYLKTIVQKPHPIGSAAHAEVRDYVFAELAKLGLRPEIQKTTAVNNFWGGSYRAGTVENVVAKLHGTANSRAVLLVAHYDAAPYSFGASDNGAGVVTLLETLRALKASAPLKNDVIFLATDGEEVGLLGALAFVQQHPWAKDAGLVLNFEARGNHGPSIMFQTSDENGWLIEEFDKTVSRPVATSLSGDIYRLLPNETDFTVFKRAGLNGFNFAYIEGSNTYHSTLDNLANLDERSLQHHGMYALSLTRHFGNADLNAPLKKSDAVYFDLFGRTLIHYSRTTAMALTIVVALVTVGVIALGLRRRSLTFSGLALGFIAFLLSLVFASLLAMLAWWVIVTVDALRSSFLETDNWTNHLYLIGFVLLAVAVMAGVYGLFRRWVSVANLAVGTLVWFLVFMIPSQFFIPGGSYLFTWPLLFALVIWALKFALPPEKFSSSKLGLMSFVLAIPGVVLLSPLTYQLFVALGVNQTTAMVVPITLVLGLFIVSFDLVASFRRWLVPVVSAVAAVCVIVAAILQPDFDRQQPKSNELFYALNADKGNAVWASFDAQADEWTSQFLSNAAQRLPLNDYFPWFEGEPLLQQQAPAVSLAAPETTVLDDQSDEQTRSIRMRVGSPREAATLFVYVESELSEVLVNGEAVPGQRKEGNPGWMLIYSAPPKEGVELVFKTKSSEPLKMTLVDRSFQLPETANAITPRPDYIVPMPFSYSDSTFVSKSFSLPPAQLTAVQ